MSTPETVRYGVARLKELAKHRIPPYEFPPDSFLEGAVRDIIERADSAKTLTASMNNRDAWRLGEVANKAMAPEQRVGDYIDRGLILRRLLEEEGYLLIKK